MVADVEDQPKSIHIRWRWRFSASGRKPGRARPYGWLARCDAACCPAAVFDASDVDLLQGHRVLDSEAQGLGLHLLPDRMLAERVRRVEHDLAFVRQALQGVETAIVRPIAVSPVVSPGVNIAGDFGMFSTVIDLA